MWRVFSSQYVYLHEERWLLSLGEDHQTPPKVLRFLAFRNIDRHIYLFQCALTTSSGDSLSSTETRFTVASVDRIGATIATVHKKSETVENHVFPTFKLLILLGDPPV